MDNSKELIAWEKSREFVKNIYQKTLVIPDSEKFGIMSQIRQTAVSIPTNIANGTGRNSQQELLRFLENASGSASEVETLLYVCRELGYLSEADASSLSIELDVIHKLLYKKIEEVEAELSHDKSH